MGGAGVTICNIHETKNPTNIACIFWEHVIYVLEQILAKSNPDIFCLSYVHAVNTSLTKG